MFAFLKKNHEFCKEIIDNSINYKFMYLKKIHITNFRCFKTYSIELAPKVTILFGKNGSGKTTLIHAIHKALSFMMHSDNVTQNVITKGKKKKQIVDVKTITNNNPYLRPKSFAKDDFNNHEDKFMEVEATADFCNDLHDIKWKMSVLTSNYKLRTTEFIDAFRDFYAWHESSGELPLLAYFSDSFPHKEDNKKSKAVKKIARLRNFGYFDWDEEEGCTNEWIERLESNLRHLVQIFAQGIVDSDMNNYVNKDLQAHDKEEFEELKKEISAITDCFKVFSSNLLINENSKIEVARLWLSKEDNQLCIVTPTGEEYSFRRLPAGYKRLFNIVLDLAYRSYILSEGKSTDIPGIAIIDEIDLHLHPELEQIVLQLFTATFPSIQFIISTHSPLVLSNFNQDESDSNDFRLVKLFKDDSGFSNQEIQDIFGLDYNSSLSYVMETQPTAKYQDELAQAYQYWVKKDAEKAGKIADLLREKYDKTNPIILKLGL